MAQIIPVTAALIEREGRFLIAQRKPDSHLALLWEFPGGKLHFGERPEDCLAREIAEELGMRITVGPLFSVESHLYEQRQILLLVYRCTPVPGAEPQPLDVAGFDWVSPAEMSRFAFAPADLPIVDKLQGFAPDVPKR